MTTPASTAAAPRPPFFRFSWPPFVIVVIGIVLAVIPAGSAAVALAGLAAIWFGFYGFVRHVGANTRRYAPPMIAGPLWFALAVGSGAMATWTPQTSATGASVQAGDVATTGADLKAEVRFNGSQFQISNRGPRAWDDVVLTVAAGEGAYSYRAARVPSGRTISVQPSRFADASGRTLDLSAAGAPQSLTVAARVGADGQGTAAVRFREREAP